MISPAPRIPATLSTSTRATLRYHATPPPPPQPRVTVPLPGCAAPVDDAATTHCYGPSRPTAGDLGQPRRTSRAGYADNEHAPSIAPRPETGEASAAVQPRKRRAGGWGGGAGVGVPGPVPFPWRRARRVQ